MSYTQLNTDYLAQLLNSQLGSWPSKITSLCKTYD